MANKSKLNELVHKQNLQLPEYSTLPQDDGFICKLKLGEEIFVSKTVHSRKKAAEDDAAGVAVLHFTSKNNSATDKTTQAIASTDSPVTEHTTSQPEQDLVSRSTTIDSKSKTENTKEIPLSMFYPPASQQGTEKPSVELQDFCSSRGWTEPIYHLKVKSNASTCGVFVNKVLYSFNDTYSSDEEAKQEAAKRVLAMLSAKPEEELENKKQGITVIIPASKRSHPASAKLKESGEKTLVASATKHAPQAAPATSMRHTPVASTEEITTAISKLTTTDTNGVDDKDTKVKQPATTSVTNAKTTDDKSTDVKHTISDKNILQQLCQKRGLVPEYTTEYPPHEVGYISKVTVNGKTFSSTVHKSKKAAETAAAGEAINYLTKNSSEPTTTSSTMPKPPDMTVSYKNLLQEYTQKQKLPLPTFRTMADAEMSGFVSTVSVKSADGKSTTYESSPHPSKKAAEQNAAAVACQSLNLVT